MNGSSRRFSVSWVAAWSAAASAGIRRIAIRCQSRFQEAYSWLLEQGFRVHWTDLRMTLRGFAEPPPAGVLLSNWEI